MSESSHTSLQVAKEQFSKLIEHLSVSDKADLFSFILLELKPAIVDCGNESDFNDLDHNARDDIMDDPAFILRNIVSDIKKLVPFNAILPSENIAPPKIGENSDCNPDITLHIDGFLYDDDDVSELADNGKLNRHYCCDCGSKNIKPLIFISHSMSCDALFYIFNTILPTLEGKTVLDIGSRLGAVLYGAYVYTDAKRIIGVEMNEEFCQLQRDVVQKYKMDDRVTVLHKRIEDTPELVGESDVIVINNSFEFYLPEEAQINIWKMLRANMKKGTLLVTHPHMETVFKHLNTGISISDWLKPVEQPRSNGLEFPNFSIENSDDGNKYSSNIACYEVL